MGDCIPDKDYLDFIENRLEAGRGFRMILHAMRCTHCRRDILAWPGLKRLVRRSDHAGAGRKAGLTEDVMARIRAVST
jgi:hypothetical protein